MFRSFFTVGGFTLLSRVLALVRDKMIAAHLGSGALSDVWVAAFQLPDLFRRVLSEGTFNSAFVPIYSRHLEEGGEKEADLFARRTLSLMVALLMVAFVIALIFMEPLVTMLNPGFATDGRLEPAVKASRITVVYLVFISLVAGLAGILNSRRILAIPAFAYVVLNLVFLFALALVVPRSGEPLLVLSWSVVVAGLLQLAVLIASCLRQGVDLRPLLPGFDSDLKRLALIMAPGLVSAGVLQLNLLVGQAIASLQVGGKTAIFYAERIHQLPLGLIGMAAGVVLLPEITRSLRGGDEAGAKRSLCQGLEMALFLCLPATIALLVMPGEIMYAIFEGGKFEGESAVAAGYVLAAFAIGTPAFILIRVLQPGYFAREDTKTPMRYAVVSAILNLAIIYPLYLWIGPAGCALAASAAAWVNFALLWFGLQGSGFLELKGGFFSRVGRMLVGSFVMGGIIRALVYFGESWLMAEGKFFLRLGAMGIVVAVGLAIYLASIMLMRIYSPADLRTRFRT